MLEWIIRKIICILHYHKQNILALTLGVLIHRYHLKDVIIGKIYFLLVRIKIKNMDLEIRRRESTGSGPNTHVETETLAKFELMDGAPVRGMFTMLLLVYIFHIMLVQVGDGFNITMLACLVCK